MIIEIQNGRPVGYETVAEFAKRVKVDRDTIRVWVKHGKINTLKIGNDHWIKEGTEKPVRKKRAD